MLPLSTARSKHYAPLGVAQKSKTEKGKGRPGHFREVEKKPKQVQRFMCLTGHNVFKQFKKYSLNEAQNVQQEKAAPQRAHSTVHSDRHAEGVDPLRVPAAVTEWKITL